jgi:coproporphyrinogen III oxidase
LVTHTRIPATVSNVRYIGEPELEIAKSAMRDLQDEICRQVINVAGGQRYFEDEWKYDKGRFVGVAAVRCRVFFDGAAQNSGGGRSRLWASRDDWSWPDGKTANKRPKSPTRGDSDVPRRDALLPFFERAGVNYSGITGQDLPAAALARYDHDVKPGTPFTATGVSVVLHPSNPWVPSMHANVRFFHCGGIWW